MTSYLRLSVTASTALARGCQLKFEVPQAGRPTMGDRASDSQTVVLPTTHQSSSGSEAHSQTEAF
jgi:hypothetical protein